MTEKQRCGFCRRDMPKDSPVCGPKENGPCPCCGAVIVALAPEVVDYNEQKSEEHVTEQE